MQKVAQPWKLGAHVRVQRLPGFACEPHTQGGVERATKAAKSSLDQV
jgi:hypothetical protein